jgi:hypothetical protein
MLCIIEPLSMWATEGCYFEKVWGRDPTRDDYWVDNAAEYLNGWASVTEIENPGQSIPHFGFYVGNAQLTDVMTGKIGFDELLDTIAHEMAHTSFGVLGEPSGEKGPEHAGRVAARKVLISDRERYCDGCCIE